MTQLSFRTRLAYVLATAVVWFAAGSARARGDESRVYVLHIARQPLEGALQEFARQSGVQIVFFSRVTEGREAPDLNRQYTLEAALTALLKPSGLVFRIINERTVQISAPSAGAAHAGGGEMIDSHARGECRV